ncbi:MAG: HAMP domain-containing protein, partial [Eubacterium sp.]|nr:HAMP domain-containing protein [Eubacterium sp.]
MNNRTGMDLRKRIWIAFVLTILISVVFFAVLYFVLVRFTVRTIGKEYDINNPSYENLYNNTLLVSRKMDEEILEILDIVQNNPEKLGDKEFLAETNKKMQENVSFLVVTRGGEVYFNGSDALPYRYLKELLDLEGEGVLMEVPEAVAEILSGQTESGLLYRQVPIRYPDDTKGCVFLVSTLDRVAPAIRWWLVETILLILIVLALVSLLMGRWIYRGVEKPIRELKTATQNIRDGNLDFSVKNSGIEELDDLCQDFEEMRIRLKDSAESQIETDRQSKELIANITHDLKTPITTIQGYVEGILDGVADTPEKMEHYLLTIRNKTRDIDRLINELTVYSNINTNRIPYN